MVLFPPVSQDKVGYRAYNHSYYQITENSLHCPSVKRLCPQSRNNVSKMFSSELEILSSINYQLF